MGLKVWGFGSGSFFWVLITQTGLFPLCLVPCKSVLHPFETYGQAGLGKV